MFRKTLLIIPIVLLSACSITTIPPVEQVGKNHVENPSKTEIKRDIVKKQMTTEYRCKNKKIVRLQRDANQKKVTPIVVSFNKTSYKLSPQVSRQAKKYSNIRWTWVENMQGVGTLTDNSQKVLAEKCVKKASR